MIKNKVFISIVFMFFFNIFGSFLLFFPSLKEAVIALTPVNLVGMLFLFIWANSDYSFKLIKTMIVIFLLGISVELLGVATGLIFGSYSYGNSLGLQFFGTPLVIGVNWLMLSLATYGISKAFFNKNILIVVFASIMMVFTDYIIEPLSGYLDFWHWPLEEIPIQNYIAWFVVSLAIQMILVKKNFKFNTKLCAALLLSQISFFIIQYFNYGLF